MKTNLLLRRMSANVDHATQNCISCAWIDPKYRRRRSLQFFRAKKPLELFAMYTVKPIPKVVLGNQNDQFITKVHSKLTQAVPTLKTTAIYIARLFMDRLLFHTIYPHIFLPATDHDSKTDSLYQYVNYAKSSIWGPQSNAHKQMVKPDDWKRPSLPVSLTK